MMDAKVIDIKTTTSSAVRAFVGHVAKRVAQRDTAYVLSGVDDSVEIYLDFFKTVFSDVFNTPYDGKYTFDQSMINDTYRAVYTSLPVDKRTEPMERVVEEGVVLLSNFVIDKVSDQTDIQKTLH